MDVLVLGGESPRHHDWVRQVADSLRPFMEKVVFLDYRHWSTGEGIDIEHEITKATELAETLDEFVVVAKSIGTVVATLANERGLIDPLRCVFAGFPLKAVQQSLPQVAEALKELPPSTFLHNEQDPLGSASDMEGYVRAHAPKTYDFHSVPGNTTHDYLDFDLLAKLASQ